MKLDLTTILLIAGAIYFIKKKTDDEIEEGLNLSSTGATQDGSARATRPAGIDRN